MPYREAAIRHSERRAQRFARMRSGGGAFGASASTARRVPMFPYLAGAGPVAWRQIQELVRNPRGVLLLLSIVGLVSAAAIVIPWLRGGDPDLTMRMGRTGMFLVTFLPLLMGDNLACDFRRDLDRMGQLKSWPIRPLALAAGQIAPAAAFATAVQVIGVLALEIATAAIPPDFALLVLGADAGGELGGALHRQPACSCGCPTAPCPRIRATSRSWAARSPPRCSSSPCSTVILGATFAIGLARARRHRLARRRGRRAAVLPALRVRGRHDRGRERVPPLRRRAPRAGYDQNSTTWRTPRFARSSSSASLMRASG